MSDLLKARYVVTAMLLIAGSTFAATMDDELRVDPTMPLSLLATGGGGDEEGDEASGGLFGLFGVGELFTSYELSSVLIRPQDRIAVINDERVRVGDKVGSAVVASIESDHVTLNVDGELQTLKLYENSIKTLVTGDD